MSVIHGGPGPTFFTPAVADYLIGGKISSVKPDVSDIPDFEIQSKIKMVCICIKLLICITVFMKFSKL